RGGEDLDGHDPAQGRVERLEDDPHASLAQYAEDLIRPEAPQVRRVLGGGEEIELEPLADGVRPGLRTRYAARIVEREIRHGRVRRAPEVPQLVPEPTPRGEPL